ncbi:MAG: serine O-acetyltransferase EpsC [Kiritimatiellia bacterium]|jgi:serine O-acetyltransferase|uniref:serine O-acetyltransferase EpsC n=1 Tax=Atribacter sp. TaxID=2847780 RepID=UPI003D967453
MKTDNREQKPIEPWIAERLHEWAAIFDTCATCPAFNTARGYRLPGQPMVVDVLNGIVGLIFPGCLGSEATRAYVGHSEGAPDAGRVAQNLYDCVLPVAKYYCEQKICKHCGDCEAFARRAVEGLFAAGSGIRDMLQDDVQAAYEGDPAARSQIEVVMSYPGLYAVATHRIAHQLVKLGVPLIPRVMSECAHSRTGIDIHPGATIGRGFFIDHGTGVVIGETCRIGSGVKLYQGVTLGALSFDRDEHGNLVKGVKRHPDVEDNVVIYAGATILGGNTVIGHDSVIGGNVWLIHSVPPHSKVYNAQPSPVVKTRP